MKASDKVYEKSNSITSVEYVRFSHKEYNKVPDIRRECFRATEGSAEPFRLSL